MVQTDESDTTETVTDEEEETLNSSVRVNDREEEEELGKVPHPTHNLNTFPTHNPNRHNLTPYNLNPHTILLHTTLPYTIRSHNITH